MTACERFATEMRDVASTRRPRRRGLSAFARDCPFRQGVSGFGEKVEIPRQEAKKPPLKPLDANFVVPSQLKVQDGKLLYRGLDGVWSFDPATGARTRVQEVKGDFVFDVTPGGRLVTMPARKDDITHTDILADDDGSMIRRVSPWDHLYFAKFAAGGGVVPWAQVRAHLDAAGARPLFNLHFEHAFDKTNLAKSVGDELAFFRKVFA